MQTKLEAIYATSASRAAFDEMEQVHPRLAMEWNHHIDAVFDGDWRWDPEYRTTYDPVILAEEPVAKARAIRRHLNKWDARCAEGAR